MINKILDFEIKQVGEEADRTLRFVGSDETPDRDNDVIEVSGWQLEQYMKNPVFLWAHQHDAPPVGKAISVMRDDITKRLMFDVKFPTAEEYPFADTIYKLYKGGYLNATSVGFHGKKYKYRDEPEVMSLPEWQRGRRYMEQELLELSAVPVPANPNALVTIRSKGFGDDIDKIFTELKEVDLLIDTNEKAVYICENGVKTAKVKISDEHYEQLTEKSGATISAKNRAMLDEICKTMKGCGDQLQKFIETSGMMEDEPPDMHDEPDKNTDIEQIKSALEEIKAQVLLLCANKAAVVDIDLAAIEFVKSSKPLDELGIEPDELKKMISEAINEQLKGGNL